MSGAPDTSATGRSGPLAGVSVLVTRTRAQSAALAEPLEALGAEVVSMPVIEVAAPLDPAPLEAALARLDTYDWVVITSANGVKRLLAAQSEGDDSLIERLQDVRVAAVGSATASALRARGIEPDLIPEDFRAEGLVAAFREMGLGAGTKVLIPRAAEAREVLPEQLAAMGVEVDAVDLYRLVPAPSDPAVIERLARRDVDVITFASGATARYFVKAVEAAGLDSAAIFASARVASVGPITTAGIRKLGYDVDIEAPVSTMESLVHEIARHYGVQASS